MTPEEVHGIAVGTARLSTVLFIMALLSVGVRSRATQLWLVFVGALTVHFAAVVWFATANGGKNLFPGGRSLQDAGGWPTVVGIFALFYALIAVGAAARRAGPAASRPLRIADGTATTIIGVAFLTAYLPLLATSAFFALPVVALLGALGVYLVHVARQTSVQSP